MNAPPCLRLNDLVDAIIDLDRVVWPMTDPAMISGRSTVTFAVPKGDGHERFVAAAGCEQLGAAGDDGTHPDTGKMRYATRTVRGSRREALAELEVFAAQVARPRRQALDTTFGELFEQWYATAAPGWAVNTQRQTLSVIKVHLVPRFGRSRGRAVDHGRHRCVLRGPAWPRR